LIVTKRDGRTVPFDKNKIKLAVIKSFLDVDGEETVYAKDKAREIANYIESLNRNFHIEEIQDLIVNKLMASSRKDVAASYVEYRYLHKMVRDRYDHLIKAVAEKLTASNVQNQNANVDEHSFGGRMGEANDIVMKQYALDYCMSEMAKNNHLNNEIYIHDLNSYAVGMHNCLSIPFDKLLAEGFNTRQTDVRGAQSINTAFQLVAVIFQIQSLQQFGGVAATHLDWTMVPYVRKSFAKHFRDGIKYILKNEEYSKNVPVELSFDDYEANCEQNKEAYKYAIEMTERETKQAVEGMYHNLNTLQSRSGNQLPFSSINYGTCTLPEGRMVTKALLNASIDGTGSLHKTSIFPCGIFQMMKGVNREPGDPNYDLYQLALKSTAQRLYPNYANVDWSNNAGYDRNDPCTYFSTMGCRTANLWDVNGLGQQKDGRGNIAPVTIILPTLAMKAKEKGESEEFDTITTFMEILDDKLHDAKDMLLERFEWICSQPPEAAKFMYENGTMAGYIPEEGIRSALKHGTLVIGMLGLAETLQILIGCDHTEERGMKLAKHICQLYKDRCAEFKKEYSLNFGVYYTPAENLCYTAMKKFKDKYGEITNVSDREFFTNSMHVPVWKEIDPFEKIDIESQLTGYSSAGCITYVELDATAKNNLEALEAIVNYAMDKDIPYFALNVPCDTCLKCGYTDEMGDECLVCGHKDVKHLRRVTGYLTGDYKTAFNLGKQQEVEMRWQHSKAMHR
jgi:ribonucleoside-triphosphate reductase